MNTGFEKHATEQSLELYSMQRLAEPEVEQLEEHLLICEDCRVRLDESDRYVQAMRSAALSLSQQATPERAGWGVRLTSWFAMPSLAWASAAIAMAVIAIVANTRMHQTIDTGAPVTIALTAERGAPVSAPAHRNLDLNLDTRGLQIGPDVRVELVDARGSLIAQQNLKVTPSGISFDSGKALSAGIYFIRVYGSGSSEVAREYPVSVR